MVLTRETLATGATIDLRNFELGPIATATVKRSVDPAADLVVRTAGGDMVAAQEAVILVR